MLNNGASARGILDDIVDSLPSHLAVIDARGVIVRVNQAWRQFGDANGLRDPDHCVGRNYLDVCRRAAGPASEGAQQAADGIEQVLRRERGSFQLQYPCHSDGEYRWFQMRALPFAHQGQTWAVTCHENVTELKWAEKQAVNGQQQSEKALRRAQQLASIGTLTAGVAHEVNNPIGAILLLAEASLRMTKQPDLSDLLEANLRQIIDHAARAGRIVRGVLEYSQQEPPKARLENVGEVAARARDMILKLFAHREVAVRLELAEPLPLVPVNAGEIEQVMLNLLSNAINASQPGAVVEVRLGPSGDMLHVVVEDHGRGMTDQQIQRAFDPFFTTRRGEGGTGLGLSLSHAIIARHGGVIELESAPEQGTRVTVALPLRGEAQGAISKIEPSMKQ